jgi:MFS family permease
MIPASITILSSGLEIGWISPTTKILLSEDSPTGHPLSDSEMMWLGSIFPLVAAVGVFFYSYLANAYGRKFTVIAVAVPQLVSSRILWNPGASTAYKTRRYFNVLPQNNVANIFRLCEIDDEKTRRSFPNAAQTS